MDTSGTELHVQYWQCSSSLTLFVVGFLLLIFKVLQFLLLLTFCLLHFDHQVKVERKWMTKVDKKTSSFKMSSQTTVGWRLKFIFGSFVIQPKFIDVRLKGHWPRAGKTVCNRARERESWTALCQRGLRSSWFCALIGSSVFEHNNVLWLIAKMMMVRSRRRCKRS